MTDSAEVLTFEIDADTSRFQSALRDADQIGARFARTLSSAFEDVAIRGRKLDDVVRSVGLNLSKMASRAAFKPLENAFSTGFGGANRQ